MRRYLFLGSLTLALLSCAKETAPEIQQVNSICIGLPQTTKTTLGPSQEGVRQLTWTLGDKIVANGQESSPVTSAQAGTKAAEFSFATPVNYPLNVLYPAQFYKDASTITLPAIQAYAAGSFAPNTCPAVGHFENASSPTTLKNVCAVVCFKLAKGTHNHPVKGVIFTGGASEKVSGDFSLDYQAGTLTPEAGASDILKLSTGSLELSSTPIELFFVVPAGHYQGFSFRIVDKENHFMDAGKKSAIDFKAGKVYVLDTPVIFAPTGTLVDTGLGDFGSTDSVVKAIGTAQEWNSFAADYNNGAYSQTNKTLLSVQLTADLDFSECSNDFVCLNSFSGMLEGQGHSFKNLTTGKPIVGTLENASVTELILDESCTFNDKSSDCFGAIAKKVTGPSRDNIIENCNVKAKITSSAPVAGGLVGALESGTLMRYCKFSGSITAPQTVGGLVGTLGDSDMDDCTNYGNAISTQTAGRCGGVIGATLSDKCIVTGGGNYGNVIAAGSKHGLLVGEFEKLSLLSGAFVGGACYDYSSDGQHVKHNVTADNWLNTHTGGGYSSVATKVTNLTSAFGGSSSLDLKDAELRILFIGNSFTDDAVKHLPGIINAAGLSSKITMAQMYYGGRIMEEYNNWALADYTLYKFEAGASTSAWTTHSKTVSIAEVASSGRWDIITMQEHTGNWHGWVWNDDAKAVFEGMFSKLTATQKTKPAFHYILSQAYYDMNKIGAASRPYMTWPMENTRTSQIQMYEVIKEVGKKIMSDLPFDGILATGTMFQNLRTSDQNTTMDLTRDGYHMDYGLTRYGAACLLFESLITPKFGVTLDNNTYRYSTSSTTSGSYSTPVTDANASIALKAARYAMQKPYEITDMSPGQEPVKLKGSGTQEDPYQIELPGDMFEIANALSKDRKVYFKLTDNIDMSTVKASWSPVCTSDNGRELDFDGNSKTISNLSCDATSACSLFGFLNGKVHDLNLEKCTVSSEAACGILAASAGTKSVEINNVHANNCSVSTTSTLTVNSGGLVATVGNGKITQCSFQGTLSTMNKSGYGAYIGGIAGQVTSATSLSECWVDVAMKGTSYNFDAGGIVGGSGQNIAITVSNCCSFGSMTGICYAGGIAGELSKGSKVTNCYSAMSITSTYAVGGIVGRACNFCNPNTSKTFDVDIDITIKDCIAWNPFIVSTKKVSPASGYSSGAVVGFNVYKNTLAGCRRRPDMEFDMYPVDSYNVLVDQEDSGPSSPYVKLGSETYYTPYHGKAAAAGETVSSVAQALGWSSSIWNFSGNYPRLAGMPDYSGGVAKLKVSIIGDSISTFKGWINSTSVDGKTCTTHYPNTSSAACDVTSVDKTWWHRLIYSKMKNARFEENISSGNTTVVQNTTATSYGSQYWYGWDFCTRLCKLGLGSPDIILIHGGTNDLAHVSSYGAAEKLLGSQAMNSTAAPDASALLALFNAADAATTRSAAEALDFSTFCSAYVKLLQMIKVRYPSAKVVCIIGDCVSAGMQSAIKSIAGHYGAKTVDLLAINGYKGTSPMSKYDGSTHPDAAGMEYMAAEIYRQVGTWMENK